MGAAMDGFPQTPPLLVTLGTESTHTGVTDKVTMKANTTLREMNASAQSTTDFCSLEASNAATYSTFSLPSTVEPPDALHSTSSPTVFSKLISSTGLPAALQASAVTSRTLSSTASITLPISIATPTTLLSASPNPTRSTLLTTPISVVVVPFPLETSTTQLGTLSPTSALTTLTSKPSFVTSELPAGIGRSRNPSASHSKGATTSSQAPLSALLAGRAIFTRPVFFLGSWLTLSTSTLTVRTRSGIGQTTVHSTPISALTSTASQIPMTTRLANFETSFPQLFTVSYFETAKPLSKPSLISSNANSSASISPKPFLSSVDISATAHKQTSPLIKGSIPAAQPVMTVSSSQVASQIPISTYSSPSVIRRVSTPVSSPITSLKPKAMADTTVASQSLYKVPSAASPLLVNPTISDRSIASKDSRENKFITHTDSFSASSISKKPQKSIMSTVFPFRTLILPLNTTLITPEIAEYSSSSHTELKTDPVARSSGTFLPKDPSLTRSSPFFTILLSASVPPYTSHTTSSSLIPTVSRTSSLTRSLTATKTSISSLDTQGTSKSPVIDFTTSSVYSFTFTSNLSLSTNLSAALKTSISMPPLLTPTIAEATLDSQSSRVPMSSPPPKTTRISTVSLGKQSSSEEDGTISAISAGLITQSTTPMIMNTRVNATSLKAPYIFAKIPPSSSGSSLIASATTVASRMATETTDSSVADLEFFMASSSLPNTTETPMHVSLKSLFTSAVTQALQSTNETPKIIIMKTSGTTSPLSQTKITPFTASEVKYATLFERTAHISEGSQPSREQRNITKPKSTTTEKSSLPYLTVSAVQSSPFSRTTTSVKNLSLSGVLH
ncbi:uncharacterized protein, partial [Phaenicophaeus curvirostris]|uniref:uncharacterized protein n=1 Tax=Phaenicophaeus curvirostris TaxID=33595 RepID=UPI0037F0CC56